MGGPDQAFLFRLQLPDPRVPGVAARLRAVLQRVQLAAFGAKGGRGSDDGSAVRARLRRRGTGQRAGLLQVSHCA
jgi:hypothetical protein